jgi:hypothetical protein
MPSTRTASARRLPRIQLAEGGRATRNGKTLGRVIDLSPVGAFIECNCTMEVGQELWVRFEVPDPARPARGVQVQVLGEVRHRQRGGRRGLGIRFLRLEAAAAAAVQAAVAAGIVADDTDASDEPAPAGPPASDE